MTSSIETDRGGITSYASTNFRVRFAEEHLAYLLGRLNRLNVFERSFVDTLTHMSDLKYMSVRQYNKLKEIFDAHQLTNPSGKAKR